MNNDVPVSIEIGKMAEQRALQYLIKQGMKFVEQNYRCRLGEIDLIMKDNTHLVFVEVRSRTSKDYGGGIASITYNKKQKIIKATTYYLVKHGIYDKFAVRFDVVSIDGKSGQVTWLKDAFTV